MSYILGIDIGSSKVAILQARIDRDGNYECSAEATGPSRGVKDGNIVDIEETVRSIGEAEETLSNSVKLRSRSAIINISGLDTKGLMSRGMIKIADTPQEIGRRDLRRLFEAAKSIHLPMDREIVHTVPQNFRVDDQDGIDNPLGLFGMRLAGDMYIVTSLASHMENLKKAMAYAGLDIEMVVFSGMAFGYSALTESERKGGAILIDAGSGVTELSAFGRGKLSFLEVLPTQPDIEGSARALKEAFESSRIALDEITSGIVLGGGMGRRDNFAEALTAEFGLPLRMAPSESSVARGLVAYVAGKYRRNAHSPSWRSPVAYLRHKVTEMYYDYF